MTLYERLGGQAAISAVVNKFYYFMLKDTRVSHFFATTDMKKQIERQTQFITLVTGGPNKYEGTDMKAAHCKLKIVQGDFDVTWENLLQALKCFNVPEAETNQLKDIFYSVEGQIVNTKNDSINQTKNSQKSSHHQHQQSYDMNKIEQCPHMQIKLSNFESSIKHQKLTQGQKRKIKQQFINKQIQNNKPQQKLSNCPYQKHFY